MISNGRYGDAGIKWRIDYEDDEDEGEERECQRISGASVAIGFAWEAIKRQFEVSQQGIPQLLAV